MNPGHYFGAGPAALPAEVKQQINQAVIQYEDLPISILELSHRSDEFFSILDEVRKLLVSLYSIPENYHVLFMQGGASLQFDAVPLNLLGSVQHATYLDTGLWSRRAANAYRFGRDANGNDRASRWQQTEWFRNQIFKSNA